MASSAIIKLLLETADFDSKLVRTKGKTSQFSAVMKSLGGVITKAAGALGIATTAGAAFKRVIEGSEATADAFQSTMLQCTSVVDGFFATLSNGNFEGFVNGLQGIIDSAKEAFEALDELESFGARYNPKQQAQQSQIQTLLAQARAQKAQGDKVGANQSLAQAKTIAKQMESNTTAYGNYQTRAGINDINALMKLNGFNHTLSAGKIYQLADPARWKTTEAEANRYARRLKEIRKLESKQTGNGLNTYGYALNMYADTGSNKRLQQLYKQQRADINGAAAYTFQNIRDDTESKTGKRFNAALNNIYGKVNAAASNVGTEAQIERMDARINRTSGGGRKTKTTKVEETFGEGEIGAYKKQITELQKAQQHASSSEGYGALQKQIDDLNEKIKAITENNGDAAGSTNALTKRVEELQKKLATLAPGTEEYVQALKDYKKAQDDVINKKALDVDTTRWKTGDMGKKAKMVDYTSGIAPMTDEQNVKDLKKSFSNMPDLKKMGQDTQTAWQGVANTISSVGQALAATGDQGLNVAGIIAQAVANIALGFAQADAHEGQSGNIWEWIAASVAGVATMVATISQIHSATGYANGGVVGGPSGVVGGNSYSGDKLWARLNSGEVVLSPNQIARANSMLDNSAGASTRSTIQGEQIISVLRATTRRRGKSLGELL